MKKKLSWILFGVVVGFFIGFFTSQFYSDKGKLVNTRVSIDESKTVKPEYL